MKAFMAPLQELAEFEQIKEKSKTNKGFCRFRDAYGIAEIPSSTSLSETAPYRLIWQKMNMVRNL